MENLPKDVMRLMALELDMPDILNYCLTNKKFNATICESQTFWRNKYMNDFPGSKPIPSSVRNAKRVYEVFYRREKGLLPTNPMIYNTDPQLSLLHAAAKMSLLVLNSTCQSSHEMYKLCNVEETWKRMLSTYYGYLKGDFEVYKAKRYPALSWRDFYHRIVHDPSILKTGFL